jgi:hypothetical protein
MERVKLAESKRALDDRGGRPCLRVLLAFTLYYTAIGTCLTRSPRVRGCSGLAASSAIWASVTSSVLKNRIRPA